MRLPATACGAGPKLPPVFFETVRRLGVRWSKQMLAVSIRQQRVWRFELSHEDAEAYTGRRYPGYTPTASYLASTSRFGIGQIADSNCTPLGLHRVEKKIGEGWPVGAVFKSRQCTGYTWTTAPYAPITHRILWLSGLEPGFNQGGNVDTFSRYIYVHGTGDEPTLGRPASHGCIHLSAVDLIPLFDTLPAGSLVWISAN